MISPREASVALYGAWRLAKYDAQGLQYFENTATACLRSFYAAVIVLPPYVIVELLRLSERPISAGPLGVLAIESIAYVIGWTAFPLVMLYLAPKINREQWRWRYISAYNWAVVLQVALILLVTVSIAAGLLPRGMAAMVSFVATIAIFAYQWFIVRVALEISPSAATGIVILDLFISVLLDGYADMLMRGHGILG